MLAPYTRREADTRIMVHVKDVVSRGHSLILVRTVDANVVVLAIATAAKMSVPEFWIQFETGKTQRYLAVHDYAKLLGQ